MSGGEPDKQIVGDGHAVRQISQALLMVLQHLVCFCCFSTCCLITPMQTCVVVAISVFGATLGAGFQLILLTTAFGAALLLLAAFKPFAAAGANLLGMQSCGCLMLSAQAALVFNMLAALSEDNTLPEASQAANGVAAVVLVINVVFVLSVFWRVLRAVDWQKVLGLAQRMRKAAVPLCGRAAGGGGCCVGRGVAKTLSV